MDEMTMESFETEDKADLINEIMIRYGQEILQLVYSYVKNKEIAEDLTQDIFVKCYNSLYTFKGKSKFRTWLWKIAINQCKDYLKSWYNKSIIISEYQTIFDQAHKENVEQTVIQKDVDEKLATAVMNLQIKYREVIYLFYYQDLTIREIATLIGVKQNTIKTRLRRAKELLKEEMGDTNGK